MEPVKILIMGAAGRDFHNFNVHFRQNRFYRVVAFTATQIPNINDRKYPAELAGELYPDGIPIFDEHELINLIKKYDIDEVIFCYSDVPYDYVMKRSAMVNAAGASFKVMGPKQTMLKSSKPVVAICAVRTGSGKSQTTRRISRLLREAGKKVAAVRHPMPYGDLVEQKVQKFSHLEDLDRYNCTIEEREEYEPHIVSGTTVFAGVDYEAILREAEKDADIILWDGGNNDLPFYKPDLHVVVVDPHRPGDELTYYPGEANLRMADVVIINKIDTAEPQNIQQVRDNVGRVNPDAMVIDAASPIYIDDFEIIRGKRVLVVEDGPTLTHGEMSYGAGVLAAKKFGAAELIDPRPFVIGTIKDTFKQYPDIGTLLPAMGYGNKQIRDLEKTINNSDAEVVIIGTPIDLRKILNMNKPAVRVYYELQEIGRPNLNDALKKLI
jgi:predicted GTPase